jgi:hypothetical protein
VSTLDNEKRRLACVHPAVRYLVPTDGSEPYACTACDARFTWDEIEALNVARGGVTGAFKPAVHAAGRGLHTGTRQACPICTPKETSHG